MKDRLVIAGAHNPEILRLVASSRSPSGGEWHLLGFAEDDPEKASSDFHGHPIVAHFRDLGKAGAFADCSVVNNVASTPQKRKNAAEYLDELGVRWATLVDRSVIAEATTIGAGSLVFQNAVLSPGVVLGRHCYINFAAQVTHGCTIGDFSIFAPGAKSMARVSIGREVFLGPGAIVIPDQAVGDGAVIAGLSLVTRPVPAWTTALGNPAKWIFTRRHD